MYHQDLYYASKAFYSSNSYFKHHFALLSQNFHGRVIMMKKLGFCGYVAFVAMWLLYKRTMFLNSELRIWDIPFCFTLVYLFNDNLISTMKHNFVYSIKIKIKHGLFLHYYDNTSV